MYVPHEEINTSVILLAEIVPSIFAEQMCDIPKFSILSLQDVKLSSHLKGSMRGCLRAKFNFRLTMSLLSWWVGAAGEL